MEQRRWLNQSQPQTLVIACFLRYINAAFAVLDVLAFGNSIGDGGLGLLYNAITIGGGVGAGVGIANERKWGYFLGLITALAPFALSFVITKGDPFALSGGLLNLIFEIALVALLLHNQSREYQKIWFK
jgi:hypothetical protein